MESNLDLGLGTFATAYAVWLRLHKRQEPAWTWLEVVGGVLAVLAYAEIRSAATPLRYRQSIWRGFVIAGIPIICGEISQSLEAWADKDAWVRERLGG